MNGVFMSTTFFVLCFSQLYGYSSYDLAGKGGYPGPIYIGTAQVKAWPNVGILDSSERQNISCYSSSGYQ